MAGRRLARRRRRCHAVKLHNRILSLLLAVVLLIGLVPAVAQIAVAEGETYEISDFENLRDYAAMSQNVNCEGKTFRLMKDITITEDDLAELNGEPLYFGNHNHYFKGTFDGQGHTISGLTFKKEIVAEVDTALFAHTDGATIKNLTIDNAHLYADLLGGILIGHAKNTLVENVTIQNSNLSVDCADNALTLITDGGVIAGGMIGRAQNCTLYNCEINATRVHAADTGAVEALGGKGLYMGALVGSAEGTTIEYCRVINGSSVKNSYDVAVGALGGNSVYAGGITGQIKTNTKIIDSFSTASLYTYCATYVSVGAGNVGYVGGITAASYGTGCEITRCHHAGNATSKQYTIGVTDLVNTTVITNDAYDFAVQGFKPTTTGYMVDLSAAVNAKFRFVEWYRIPNVTAFSAPEGHEYFAALMEGKTPVLSEAVYSKAECVDNDLFLAHMEALVRFHDINGDVIDIDTGVDSADDSKNWYDFEQALPNVVPVDTPTSETARLIGWTTEKSSEQGGGYSSIENTKLNELKTAGNFYETGDPVEKPMELYEEIRTVSETLLDGYNFIFFDMYGIISKDNSLVNGKNSSEGGLTYNEPKGIIWSTEKTADVHGNYTHYYVAHNTADVNFHLSDGTLIGNVILTPEEYPYQTNTKTVTMTRRYQSPLFGAASDLRNEYTSYEDKGLQGTIKISLKPNADTDAHKIIPAERGIAPDGPAVAGYFFAGWAELSKMKDYEQAYAFDLSNGTSVNGAPQYISSSVDRARAYTLKSDALVEHTMELYPVYVPLGKITTTTNLSAARSDSLTVPEDPKAVVSNPDENGVQSVTLQADITTTIPGSSEPYKLLRMTVSIDGGEEIDLTTEDVNTGMYTYTPIEPGHSYLFTAYYQPYVVIFHQNGTAEMVTQLYNQYDHIRNTPLPTIQDSNSALDDYIFIGWTEQTPENGLYLTYVAEADETVTYDKMDGIYHFVDDGTSVSHAMELWPVYINIRVQVNSNIDAELTGKGVDLNTIRKVDRNAADSLQTKVVATEVEGYKFYGWYKEIPAGQLTDDTQYTEKKLVSRESSYHLTGDKPYEPTVYTARYIKVYKVIYHDLTSDVLETEYV